MARTAAAALMTAALSAPARGQSFAEDVAFLKKHTGVVVLSRGTARVAVCPDLQGRVMTSSARGEGGQSFGWINRELLASGRRDPHFNAYGGEDRFWLGPEGGQFALFFKKGDPFDLAHWYTPPAIDTEPYPVASQTEVDVRFRKDMDLLNYSGTRFALRLDRTVRLVEVQDALRDLGVSGVAGVEAVAYESDNRIENTGREAWRKETGLLSVWILGMFNPSPATTVVVPYGPDPQGTPAVNDAYFGKVPADRLVVREGVAFFRGDGKYRSKIGIPPARARSVLGSYDGAGRVLTLVEFTLPKGARDYVNSMWEIQKAPYGGDVANSYNDGPPAPGAKPLGPFYELETSSPAAALAPGAALVHRHRTLHLVGDEAALDAVARKVLGTPLADIKAVFGSKP
jgi:hypothetical protein